MRRCGLVDKLGCIIQSNRSSSVAYVCHEIFLPERVGMGGRRKQYVLKDECQCCNSCCCHSFIYGDVNRHSPVKTKAYRLIPRDWVSSYFLIFFRR